MTSLDKDFERAIAASQPAQKWGYHGTNKKTYEIIRKRGLVPQKHEAYTKPVTWFTDDSIGARFYGNIVLRFPFPADGEFDDTIRGYGQFVTSKTIKPTSMNVWEEDVDGPTEGWISLVPVP